MKKKFEATIENIRELREELIKTCDMTLELARSNYEIKKAQERNDNIISSWNILLRQWKELKEDYEQSEEGIKAIEK